MDLVSDPWSNHNIYSEVGKYELEDGYEKIFLSLPLFPIPFLSPENEVFLRCLIKKFDVKFAHAHITSFSRKTMISCFYCSMYK